MAVGQAGISDVGNVSTSESSRTVSSDENGLTRFVQWYNAHRPHHALKGLSPSDRLGRLQAAGV